jgi:D-alanyl-D-alanine carboxypeptidase/D-alanyl-D-alanine carboxypeptidase (penicillin-binding protein 5/6)
VVALFLKKIVVLLLPVLVVSLLFGSFQRVQAETEELELSAASAVVYCVETGQVVYGKNESTPMAMASTTKIMTALLSLEAAATDNRVITVTEEMIAVEGSSMGLKAGDQLTLTDLAAGMLLTSGNDAANAAAIGLDGSLTQFAERMNARAKEIGMTDTHFVTPSGLDDDDHYSTALDMAKLGAAAIGNEGFRAICSQTSMEVSFVSPEKTVTLTNHNRLLQLYDGCIGVKTGYTQKAGRCLVSAAERDGVTLVAVTLSAPDDWADHEALLDYGFSCLERISIPEQTWEVPVIGGEKETVQVTCGTEASFVTAQGAESSETVELPPFVYGPVDCGDVIGYLRWESENGEVVSIPLSAAENVAAEQQNKTIWQKIGQRILGLFSR